MYLLMRAKSLMSLKIWSNLGLAKKNSKSPYVGLFLVNHAKSKFPYGVSIVFRTIYLKFTQKRELPSLRAQPSRVSCTNRTSTKRGQFRSLQAKRTPQVSEPSAVYANQANQANQAWRVRAKRASRANRSLRKPAKRSKSSRPSNSRK